MQTEIALLEPKRDMMFSDKELCRAAFVRSETRMNGYEYEMRMNGDDSLFPQQQTNKRKTNDRTE